MGTNMDALRSRKADFDLLGDLNIQRDRRRAAEVARDEAMQATRKLVRQAHGSGITKVRIAEAAGISRPTLDDLLNA